MPIVGLTDKTAAFPVIGTLRKGEKKPNEKQPGADLTHFRFVSEDTMAHAMFAEAYPDEEALRHINVYLPHRTTDENMDCWIEKWVAGGLVYRSDGERMVLWQKPGGGYSTEPKPDPAPKVGEDGKRADGSGQVGRLSVIIPELGRLATVTVMTTSKHDIINVTRQLRGYEALRQDLRGIPFVLVRRPVKISTPGPGGKRVRREKWLLSIETEPRWTMLQLTSQARAALPEGGEIVETDEYEVLAQLPAGIIAPDDEPEHSASNGKARSTRPLDAEPLREMLRHKANGNKEPASKAQIGLVASKLEECFAGDDDARAKRLTVLGYVWDIDSASKLAGGQAKAMLDWLLTGAQDSGGDYPLHPHAPEEARRLHRAALVAAGQEELPF